VIALLACVAPGELARGPHALMQLDGAVFDAPFPRDSLRGSTVDLSTFPHDDNDFVLQVLDLLATAEGFGTTSPIHFPLSTAPSELPLEAFVLEDVDPASDEQGRTFPLLVDFQADAGPYGAENLLSLLPLQGLPLRPNTTYRAAITALDADEEAFVPHPLCDGDVACTVFTTWDPTAELDELLAEPLVLTEAPTSTLSYPTYDVLEGRVTAAVYQTGEPPYWSEGGGLSEAVDHHEEGRLIVTVPEGAAPASGWPVAVFIRTGGGGEDPLLDRGIAPAADEPAAPGTGPAVELAAAGFVGVQLDGPHGGVRNVSGSDEQFLIFNVANPAAMRGNIQQSALELRLLPALLAQLDLPLDLEDPVLIGHSMGATIAPLAAEAYGGLVLSGAGGSWIENIVHKQSPLEVRPLAEAVLGYSDRTLHEHDPALGLLQWAGEGADPPVWAERVPEDVLMFQGIVDTYILPDIANATSLSLALDLAGEALDESVAWDDQSTYLSVAGLVGAEQVAFPVEHRALVQQAEDGLYDGHEVFFQTPEPRQQLQCFLASSRTGLAIIAAPGACPDG